MEPKNQIETKVIQELTDEFKLADILKVTNFPKSTYYYWVKKMEKDNPNQELEDLILTIFKENDENYQDAYSDGYDSYQKQPLEESARVYATEETERVQSYIHLFKQENAESDCGGF